MKQFVPNTYRANSLARLYAKENIIAHHAFQESRQWNRCSTWKVTIEHAIHAEKDFSAIMEFVECRLLSIHHCNS